MPSCYTCHCSDVAVCSIETPSNWFELALLLTFFALAANGAAAQGGANGFEVRRLSMQDGLKNQVITSVCTNRQGFLWFGTNDGLYMFDGMRSVLIEDESLKDQRTHFITDIETIENDRFSLLFVCSSVGSYLIDLENRERIRGYSVGLPDSVLWQCNQIEKCPDGSFLALGRRKIYRIQLTNENRFDIKLWCTVPNTKKPQLAIDPATPGSAWIFPASLDAYQVQPGSIRHFPLKDVVQNSVNFGGMVTLARTGHLGLVGWDHMNGLYQFDPNQQQFIALYPSMTLDSVYPGVGAIEKFLKIKTTVLCRLLMESGQEVFGTTMGLFILKRKTENFRLVKSMAGQEIRAILADSSGHWWAGTYSGLMAGAFHGAEIVNQPELKAPWAFLPLGGQDYLLGLESYQGLVVWNSRTGSWKTLPVSNTAPPYVRPASVLTLCRDTRGNTWVGTYTELLWSPPETPFDFRRLTTPKHPHGVKSPYIRALALASDSSLWFGAENGLYRLRGNPAAGQCTIDTLLPGTFVSHIYPDRQGDVWVATKGRGIARFQQKQGTVEWFDANNGLCNNYTCRIEGSNNDRILWISTHYGLSRFDRSTGVFHNYFESDGLPGNEFNSAASVRFPDGTLMFGGVNGLLYFHPLDLQPGNFKYETFVPFIRIYDNSLDSLLLSRIGTEPLYLKPYPNFIEFFLGSNQFINTDKVRFRYRLNGLSNDWSFIEGKQEIRFFRLAPGDYVLEVQAVPLEGHFGPPRKVAIHVATPFYETWWFNTLLLAAIIGIAYAAYLYRLRQLLKEQSIRRQIADDLHDDIGNKLNILSILAQKIAWGIRKGETAVQENTLQKLTEVSGDALRSLHHMIWSIDPVKDRLLVLFTKMQDFADDYLQPLNIQHSFQLPPDIPDRNIKLNVRHHLMLIYQELMTNMIKHTNPRRIDIKIRITDMNNLELTLSNEFQPLPGQPVVTHSAQRGQASTERRLQQIGGRIQQVNFSATGQSIVLFIPNIFK